MSRRGGGEGPLGGLGARGARARVAPVDEAAMQAKLRELRSVMAKERTARTEAAQRDGGERGTHLELEQAHDAPVAGRGLEAARAHRGGAGAHPEGKRPSRGFGPSRRDRRGHRRTRAKPLGETRLGSPRRECLLGARRVGAVAARVRVVVRPAERVRRGARSSARDERGVRPPARERAPGARGRGRIGGARAGWRHPPRPAAPPAPRPPAARPASRPSLRAARAERARERPLNDERASGCVAPRRERHDRAHGRRHDRARGRRGGRRGGGFLFKRRRRRDDDVSER